MYGAFNFPLKPFAGSPRTERYSIFDETETCLIVINLTNHENEFDVLYLGYYYIRWISLKDRFWRTKQI